MTRLKTAVILLVAFLLTALPLSAKRRVHALPDIPIPHGISAPFAGVAPDGALIVAGGCNFPVTPAADGGKKVYYADIFRLAPGAKKWARIGSLPAPTAYGVSIATPLGLVCIGGQTDAGSTSLAYMLKPTAAGVERIDLPALPVKIDNGGGALIGRTIYVVAGAQKGVDAAANDAETGRGLFALSLDNPAAWVRLADYPDARRQQPVVVADETNLYLIGGFDFDKADGICRLSNTAFAFSPERGTWQVLSRVPEMTDGSERCVVGAAGVEVGGSIVIAGGVNAGIFRPAVEGRGPSDYMRRPVEWYQFGTDVLTYRPTAATSLGNWTVSQGFSEWARAGGMLVRWGDEIVMICGETKPGIRSAQVNAFAIADVVSAAPSPSAPVVDRKAEREAEKARRAAERAQQKRQKRAANERVVRQWNAEIGTENEALRAQALAKRAEQQAAAERTSSTSVAPRIVTSAPASPIEDSPAPVAAPAAPKEVTPAPTVTPAAPKEVTPATTQTPAAPTVTPAAPKEVTPAPTVTPAAPKEVTTAPTVTPAAPTVSKAEARAQAKAEARAKQDAEKAAAKAKKEAEKAAARDKKKLEAARRQAERMKAKAEKERKAEKSSLYRHIFVH